MPNQKTRSKIKSASALMAVSLCILSAGLCTLSCLAQGKIGHKGSATVVLNFPSDHSMGALYQWATTDVSGSGRKYLGKAMGKVVVPTGIQADLNVSYEGGKDIAHLSEINTGVIAGLTMKGLEVSDKDFESLRCLENMRSLTLQDLDITDRGFMTLQRCKKLEDLKVQNCQITARALEALTGMTNLRRLNIEVADLSGNAIRHLSGLKNLDMLILEGDKLDDVCMPTIGQLTNISWLNLSVNHVTDRGVQHLSNLKKLVRVDLRSTKITAGCVKSLAQLPKLEVLIVSFADLKPGDVQMMQRALPKCTIIDGKHRGPPKEVFEPLH